MSNYKQSSCSRLSSFRLQGMALVQVGRTRKSIDGSVQKTNEITNSTLSPCPCTLPRTLVILLTKRSLRTLQSTRILPLCLVGKWNLCRVYLQLGSLAYVG